MTSIKRTVCFFFLLAFFISISGLHAHIVEYDDYWKNRQAEAERFANQAYKRNPEGVTRHFNRHVARAVLAFNRTRRSLDEKPNEGSCEATNPIDQCWRCDPGWANKREKLADCALGFARGTIGGKNGKIYVVKDASDDDLVDPKPGTLRHAVIQKEPLWIVFERDMTIKLSQELIMASDKTIDGRGAVVHVANGAGITIQFVKNIIIHGLHIHDIKPGIGGMIRDSVDHAGRRGDSDGDGISIFGSSNVWLDHLSMSSCKDGLIDAIAGSTAITISNSYLLATTK